MDNRLKRFLSLALAMVMVIGMMPTNIAFATETEDTPNAEEKQVLLVDDLKDNTQETPEPVVPVVAAATGCTLIEGCALNAGHSGDCKDANEQILVNPSSVLTAAGLKAAIGTGGTIVLAADIELKEAITVTSTTTLDLNGHDITVAAPAEGQTAPDYALINKSTLTVKGEGSVAGMMNEGNLTVQSGTFVATSSTTYALHNKGTATINDGTFNVAGGSYALYNASAKQMSIKDATVYGVYNASGIVTVSSGEFNGNSDAHAVYSMGGSLTVTGGEFHNNTADVATVLLKDTCSATISGGTITNEAKAPALAVETTGDYGATISGSAVIKSGIAVADGAILTVNGGSFQDPDDNSFSNSGTDNITVNGGTFEDENSQNFARAYAAEGKILIFKENNVEVKKVRSAPGEVSDVIATIGSGAAIVGYPSLDAAVQVGGTVDLIADTTVSETIEISKSVILNLNGHSVDAGIAEDAIEVKVGGSLTVNGTGSITNTAGNAIKNHGTLVVNGGTITGYYALYNGSYFADTATATLNGGTFSAAVAEDYSVANCGRMTVNGATINDWLSTSGVFEMTDGSVAYLTACAADVNPASGISTTIKGGKITYLDSSDFVGSEFGNVITVEAGAQNTIPEVETIYATKQENAETLSKIYIKDGKIGSVGTWQFDDNYEEIENSSVAGVISITGGTFNSRPDDVHVKAGYEIVENQITGGVVYIVRLKKVDLLNPTGETLNNLIGGDKTAASRDQVLADIRNNENFKVVTNESGYTLFITPTSVVIEAGSSYKTSRITYSVTPMDTIGNKISNPGVAITFNLPIPGTLPDHVDYANVYHGTEKMTGPETDGIFAIKGEGNQRYVTVTSDTFSDFTVEMIDVDYSNHVAKIGVKGYESVQAAIDAVQDGQTIELLQLPEQKVYGPAVIDLSKGKSFTIDGTATVNNAEVNRAWYYDGDATITISGTSPAGKKVTIKNIEFNRVNKATGEFIKITGNGSGKNSVEILDCTFAGAGSSSGMVAVNLINTNGVVINGGVASGLRAFLTNLNGKDLTVKNVTIRDCNVGMELGAVQGVNVEGVTITSTVGKYGISMDASVNNNAVFTSCNITAAVPVMVYGSPRTTHGKIAFNGTSTMTGSSGYWIILADEKYSEKPEGTNPESLTTTGRIVITVTDAGLLAAGINDKHMDESDASARKYYTVEPKGKLESAVAFDESAEKDSHISVDIQDLVASERVVVEIYDEAGTKIAVTKLVNNDVLYTTPMTGVVEIARQSGSWDTTWLTAEKCPTYRNVPAKAKLIVDGKVLGEVPVEMYVEEIPEDARVWTDIEGVGNVTLTEGDKVTWKHTLAEAFDAVPAEGTGTVTLFADNKAVLSAAGEVTGGKTVTVTGEATFAWNQDWLFIGRGENPGDGTLIFDNAKIKAYDGEGNEGDKGFHVSGAKANTSETCDGTLKIINGSNVEVDFFIDRNYVELDDSVLTVKYGFYVHGRPADETPDGNVATAGMDVTNGAVLNVQSAVKAILGEEGNGELNVHNTTFNCTADIFEIVDEPDTQLNVTGTSTLNIKKLEGKAINLLDEATIKDSSVGGKAIVAGTADKKATVTFTGTKKFDTIEATHATVNFTGSNTAGDVTVTNGIANISGTSKFNDVAITGTATITGTSTVHNMAIVGTLNTNTESVITANKISLESDADKIIIDATNLADEDGVTVINLSGDADSKAVMSSTRVSVKDDFASKRVADDGDVIVYFEAYVDKDKDGAFDVGEGYATLEKAVAAAGNNETVVLLANASIEAAIEISKKIALDLNTKTISSSDTGFSALKVTASGVTVKNGEIYAVKSGNAGIEVAKNAAVEVIGVEVNGKTAGIKAYGSVTIGEGSEITAQDSNVAIRAYDDAVVTINGGTVSKDNSCAIEMNDSAQVTVNGGEVSGAPAVRINGGDLTVAGGKITAKAANAIVTCSDSEGDVGATSVTISKGEINGAIVAQDDADGVVPQGYEASVVITGGNFTNSYLDRDYLDKEYGSIAVSGGTFDKWVSIEMCAIDYICQKKANTELYEVVYYEHVRIYMNDVDDNGDVDGDGVADDKVVVGDKAYADGEAYEVVPGKVLLVDKEQAAKSAMFITTYGYETKDNNDAQDDYPDAMYVWYAVGEDANKDGIYESYAVERVEILDNFFQYNGTSIRVGGSNNGIRFFSSVDVNDANKLMNGTLISEGTLDGATMTQTGTEFWKTNKLRSEVYGGAVGNSFRVFQTYSGRNWFTGVLVGLDTDGKTVYDPIYSRPYAEIQIGDETATLYGGILTRSIYYVAKQNVDTFTQGTSHDNFVENLIKLGDDYLASLNNNSGTESEGGSEGGTEGGSESGTEGGSEGGTEGSNS